MPRFINHARDAIAVKFAGDEGQIEGLGHGANVYGAQGAKDSSAAHPRGAVRLLEDFSKFALRAVGDQFLPGIGNRVALVG